MNHHRLFDTLQDVVLVIDSSYNLFYGNSAASALTSISARRLNAGKPLANYLTFAEPIVEVELPVTEPTKYREIGFLTVDGKDGWAQVSVQIDPLTTEGPEAERRWIVYMRDVTLERTLQLKYRAELDKKEKVIEDLQAARSQLQNYSKNLEQMVEDRTAKLRETNQLLAAILDSLGQGIVVFDREGICFSHASKKAVEMFLAPPRGPVADLLRLGPAQAATLKNWIDSTFAQMLPFEDMVGLGPHQLQFRDDRFISLDYFPMYGSDGTIKGLVMVATDQTSEVQARAEASRERAFAQMILRMASHAQQFRSFAADSRRIISALQEMLHSQENFSIEEFGRHVHTLKGGAGSFGLVQVSSMVHDMEEMAAKSIADNIHPAAAHIDQLEQQLNALNVDLEELLTKYSNVYGGHLKSGERYAEISASTLFSWNETLASGLSTGEMRQQIWNDFLLQPIAESFSHLNDVLASLAAELGKEILPLHFANGSLKIFPEHYQAIFGSLIHVFRNAIDHGLETSQERESVGKDPKGHMAMHFCDFVRNGCSMIRIEIHDDGRGIDPELIRERLEKLGLEILAKGTDEEVIQAIFLDRFSTRDVVSALSGRGFGLAAAKVEIETRGGAMFVRSILGRGTVFVVEIPRLDRQGHISVSADNAA